MRDSQEQLYRDLDRYIREHWIPGPAETEKAGLQAGPGKKQDYSGKESVPGADSFGKTEVPPESDNFEKTKVPLQPDDLYKGSTSGSGPFTAVSLEELISEVGQSFHEVLFRRIEESGMTDVEVYKRANLDRKLFSKIRSNPAYHPRKDTVLALAIALKLDITDTEDFLARAEYAFSPGSKSDVIIRYFVERKIYDIQMINTALYDHGLPVLQ